jgi:predicted butyrate kinase (DUF1464 family)
MLEMELPPVPVSIIQDMRRTELPIQKISAATGLQKSTIYTALEKKSDGVVKPRPHATENVEVKEEVKEVNPLEEAWKNINKFLSSVGKDADELSKRLFSNEKFVDDVKALDSLIIALSTRSFASNVKNEKLRGALYEGAENVLRKGFIERKS